MAKISREIWWWLIGIGGSIVILATAFFLFLRFYTPLVLMSKISSQDIVGYLEWHRVEDIDTQALPELGIFTELNNKLPCSLFECDFWGSSSALVLRNRNGQIVPELYFYQPLVPSLNETWAKIANRNNKLTIGQHEFELRWFDNIAVISANPITTVAKINTVADMPWVKESKLSAWGQKWGAGYCTITCLNWLASSNLQQPNLALMPAFLNSTVRYISVKIHPQEPFQMSYQLFFTDQYHNAVSTKRVFRDLTLSSSDIAAFAGDNFTSKMRMLDGNTQNAGLWQTVQSLWSTAPTGEAWWNIITSIGNYPYTVYLNTTLPQTRLELEIPEGDKQQWKDNLAKNIEHYAAILFPQKVTFKLPDGTTGAEYVKNNNLLTSWLDEGPVDVLQVQSQAGDKVFKIYVQDLEKKLVLGLNSPIRISSANAACFQSPEKVEEFSVYYLPQFPYFVQQTVTESSTQVVSGNVYFDKQSHSC